MMIKNISNLLLWGGALAGGGGGGNTPSGGEDWIGDGNTHIWISLQEGRTSPMLGVCPNGTVTVDWGDGSTPDVLTGTSTSTVKYTPNHNYASAGDYVITLTVEGEMGFVGDSFNGANILRYSSTGDKRTYAYRNAVQKVEIGNSVTSIGDNAFNSCYNLASVSIPDGVTSIGDNAFNSCYNLASVSIPDGVTSIGSYAFGNCRSLASVSIPDGVTSIGNNAFSGCYNLASVSIPDGVTSIGGSAFSSCYCLTNIKIPDGVTSIGGSAFGNCYSLAKMRFDGTTPPTVANSNAFSNVPTDCIISVPVGSLDAYKTATNYPDPATYTYVEE
jgi:hypothetical protein